jgi:type IV pilus assembly protein PilB
MNANTATTAESPPKKRSGQATHWMARVLDRGGFTGAGEIVVPADASITRLWEIAMEASGLDEDALAAAIGAVFRIGVADFDRASPTAQKLLPASVVQKFGVFPIRDEDRYLVVATSDPTNLEAEDEVAFASGRSAKIVVAPPELVEDAIANAYSPNQAVESLLSRSAQAGEMVEILAQESEEDFDPDELGTGPVVRLGNMILEEAIALGSSDVHIQPSASGGIVRFRVDGVLRTAFPMPKAVYQRVISRIKIMGGLDITDRMRPQDGRARVAIEGHPYDLRISTVPTQHSEKSVIRILDPDQGGTLDGTGMSDRTIESIRHTLSHREGIFIVTGPTGSGKTTTMYSALREIATESVNIMTVEDPIEYQLEGLTQIPVDNRTGVTFASALRAVLRQDPDVIFVGEIRDEETAAIAVQASMTGHLVLATLHTNDAVGTIHRFIDLGLDPTTIVGTLKAAVAQRLMRKVCSDCSEPIRGALTEKESELSQHYGIKPIVRARGCTTCTGEGYRGRVPVNEFLTITPDLVRLVIADAAPIDLQEQARSDGMKTLLQSALDRVLTGETTLEEVERVIGLGDAVHTEALPEAPVAPVTQHVVQPISQPITQPAAMTPAPTLTPDPSGDQDFVSTVPRVLVVDDDGTNRMLARGLLEKEGYHVAEASDGSDALVHLARGEHVDLMILDLDMPILGGREVLSSVRNSMTTAGLPVVVLTGTPDPEADIELMEQGADDYIRKPIDPLRFMSRVKAVLRRAQG